MFPALHAHAHKKSTINPVDLSTFNSQSRDSVNKSSSGNFTAALPVIPMTDGSGHELGLRRGGATGDASASYPPVKSDKKSCVQTIRERVRTGQMDKQFVESNADVFRSLGGRQRKELVDVARKIDLPKIKSKDDPVTKFFLKEFKGVVGGQQFTKSYGPLHYETEDMALDWEHCGVLEIGRYDFDQVDLTFNCTESAGFFKGRKGEGTVEMKGRYQRFIKCYKDFKESSEVGVTQELPKFIFRGEVTQAKYTPENIEYIVGEKKRSLKWGYPRVNLYKVESGVVEAKTIFTQKNHPDNDKGGTVS